MQIDLSSEQETENVSRGNSFISADAEDDAAAQRRRRAPKRDGGREEERDGGSESIFQQMPGFSSSKGMNARINMGEPRNKRVLDVLDMARGFKSNHPHS